MDDLRLNLDGIPDLDLLVDPQDDLVTTPFSEGRSAQHPVADDFSLNHDTGDIRTNIDAAHPLRARSPTEPSTADASAAQQSQNLTAKTAKAATRFSSESVRILRQWLSNHETHPYATPEEVDMLQGRTGLTKQQVHNWLANARRRYYKFQVHGSSSRIGRGWSETTSTEHPPMNIPPRRPTPIPFENMNPLERWENSPPEHEAAAFFDISRIVAASPRQSSTPYYLASSDISSSDASSVSSAGVSRSSHGSRSSSQTPNFSNPPSLQNGVRRKRRKLPMRRPTRRTNLLQPRHRYQCTFCVETFKHKYDWQRHEKSIHLELEEWVCSPNGPTDLHPELGLQACVYCAAPEPDESHLRSHHHWVCQEREVSQRTFHRKDHLRQHLKLVHETNFMSWPMDKWQVATSRPIRSRCGFCDLVLESWADRTDHLAGHFKAGLTMTEWKGDWGFDPDVVDMVDNAMPAYMIHEEANAVFSNSPMRASPDTPTSAYELLKLELEYFTQDHLGSRGCLPTDDDLQYEGCSVIFGADMISSRPASSAPSWLRDLFLSSDKAERARLLPLQHMAKSRFSQLKINGKHCIFDDCDLEIQLCRLVTMQSSVGVALSDYELQEEAAKVLSHIEAFSPNPSKHFADFVLRLLWSSKLWIEQFRERQQQQLSTIGSGNQAGHSSIAGLPSEHLAESLQMGLPPMTEADMSLFPGLSTSQAALEQIFPDLTTIQPATTDGSSYHQEPNPLLTTTAAGSQINRALQMKFLLNDHNSYSRLAAALARFVRTTMSPNNPNRHVPTDNELRYQARWMWYDEDDPWNQTPADNDEWLCRFKLSVGLTEGLSNNCPSLE